MHSVHQNMPITLADFNQFNSIFVATLGKLGVSSGDQTTVLNLLKGFQSQIVRTICEKYALALKVNETTLMYTIVGKVVGGEVANPNIKIYFDGTKPKGSTNFLASDSAGMAAYAQLAGGLVAFFGNALGCNDPTFPKYSGPDMQPLHQPLMITLPDFNTFNDIFITQLGLLGVDSGDQTTIRSVLDSFQSQIVYSAPAPTNGTSPSPGGGGVSHWDKYGRTILVGCITGLIMVIGILFTLIECVK